MNASHVQSPEVQFLCTAEQHWKWRCTTGSVCRFSSNCHRRSNGQQDGKKTTSSFYKQRKKSYLCAFHVHSFLFRRDGKGKKRSGLETELKRGLEEHSAKTSTSSASEGEGVGGAEARERGMREAEEE